MRSVVVLLTALCVGVGSGFVWAGEEGMIDKVCKAYGKVEALSSLKAFRTTGVIKYYGGGLSKYEFTDTLQFPAKARRVQEGVEGTFDKSGNLLVGEKGWSFRREAFRAMAPDELKAHQARFQAVDWLGRLKRGEQKYETVADAKFDEVECAGIALTGLPKRKVKLYFDKSTWLLYRREEEATNRDGSIAERYTLYEDYEAFEGVQFPLTRTVYANQLVPRTKIEKFRLVQKVLIDEIQFTPEIEEGTFKEPVDLFHVGGLDAEAGKERAQKLLEFFKGRRDPNMAGWACKALAELKAQEALKVLEDSRDKELRHYAYLGQIRMDRQAGVPENFQAVALKRKVDIALGYTESEDKISVRYAGSSGVRIELGGVSLFINAFYQPGLFHTAYPGLDPKTVLQADVLLFTHAHRDHFDPWLTAEILQRTQAKVAGPPTVIALLKERGIAEDRLIPLSPGKEKPVKVQVGKAEVEAFPVDQVNETTEKGKPEHIVFRVKVGELSVLHLGEAREPKGMEAETVAGARIVILPHWMLKEKHREFFKKTGVRYMIPTCFIDTPGMYGSMKNLGELWRKLVPLLPGHTVVF
ncbi:MAG: MBL fold metallo-hydrolase [Planctomycetota bacterium]|jgi:L-ascorbate metabolism protein UlaG (beta-lactamase superfamily)